MAYDTLFPVVQLRFGTATNNSFENTSPFIVTIPPNNLLELTFVSDMIDECTISFIDPTFGRVEQELMRADREEKGTVLLRWGYPGLNLEKNEWRSLEIVDFTPDIAQTGIRMSIRFYSFGANHASRVRPSTYQGKISSVALQIAHDMGYTDPTKIFIEETEDANADIDPKRDWGTQNKSPIDFIHSKLLPEAKSKTNPNGVYDFRLGSERTFEFCTQHFKKVAQEVHGSPEPEKEKDPKKRYRSFEVLFGIPDGREGASPNMIVNWRPSYISKAMGSFARASIAGVFDPRTKQFTQTLIDRNTQGMSSSKDPKSGGRTTSPPITDSKDKIEQRKEADSFVYQPAKQVALGGHCSGKNVHDHQGPVAALNKITAAWKFLHNSINGATLEIYGVPENCDVSWIERFINVIVVMPAFVEDQTGVPEGTNQGVHWSSGLYQIKRVTHSINQNYIITIELFRPTSLDGPAPAKTGQPDIVAPTITSVS